MPKRKIPEADPEQFQRFLETARELGCEENLADFDEAVRLIGKARPRPRTTEKATKAKDKER
jgi:hypothetical protein